jgi:hypothetical protein
LTVPRYGRKLSRVDADALTIHSAIEEVPAERAEWWAAWQV